MISRALLLEYISQQLYAELDVNYQIQGSFGNNPSFVFGGNAVMSWSTQVDVPTKYQTRRFNKTPPSDRGTQNIKQKFRKHFFDRTNKSFDGLCHKKRRFIVQFWRNQVVVECQQKTQWNDVDCSRLPTKAPQRWCVSKEQLFYSCKQGYRLQKGFPKQVNSVYRGLLSRRAKVFKLPEL